MPGRGQAGFAQTMLRIVANQPPAEDDISVGKSSYITSQHAATKRLFAFSPKLFDASARVTSHFSDFAYQRGAPGIEWATPSL